MARKRISTPETHPPNRTFRALFQLRTSDAPVIKLFLSLHNEFFENDEGNFKTLIAGFVLCAVCMGVIFGLYQL